jgi:hypothetical protein
MLSQQCFTIGAIQLTKMLMPFMSDPNNTSSIAEANRLAAEKFSAHENVTMDCGWRCPD